MVLEIKKMCLILDTNKYGDFLNPDNADMQPVRKWLDGRGKIAYSPTQKFESELTKQMRSQFDLYRDVGKMKLVNESTVQGVQNNLTNLKSDDPHIIALAIVAKVKLLVSGDKDLHDDFKDHPSIKGKVYQNQDHEKLLTPDLCP